MAQVPAAPRPARSYDGDRREILAEQARLAREKPPVSPGSVQSTDGSVIRIPGPLSDVGRDGYALIYDEDLHQPVWRASGGIVGMAEVVATAGTVEMPSGYGNLAYEGVTYDSPYDPNGGSAPSWLTVGGHQLTVTEGWYIPVLYVRVVWDSQASAPVAFGPYIQGGGDSVHNDYSIIPASPTGGGLWGCVQIVNHGPTYLTADIPLHAELRAIGGAAPGGSNTAESALLWTITKLS